MPGIDDHSSKHSKKSQSSGDTKSVRTKTKRSDNDRRDKSEKSGKKEKKERKLREEAAKKVEAEMARNSARTAMEITDEENLAKMTADKCTVKDESVMGGVSSASASALAPLHVAAAPAPATRPMQWVSGGDALSELPVPERLDRLEYVTQGHTEQLTELQAAKMPHVLVLKPREVPVATLKRGVDTLLKDPALKPLSYANNGRFARPLRLWVSSPDVFQAIKALIERHIPGVLVILESGTSTKMEETQTLHLKKMCVKCIGDKTQVAVGWPSQGFWAGHTSWCIAHRDSEFAAIACQYFPKEQLQVMHVDIKELRNLNVSEPNLKEAIYTIPKGYKIALVEKEKIEKIGRNKFWAEEAKGKGKGKDKHS